MIYHFNYIPATLFLKKIREEAGNMRFEFGHFRTKYKVLNFNKLIIKRCPKVCPKVSDLVRKWFEFRTRSDKLGQVFALCPKVKTLITKELRLKNGLSELSESKTGGSNFFQKKK